MVHRSSARVVKTAWYLFDMIPPSAENTGEDPIVEDQGSTVVPPKSLRETLGIGKVYSITKKVGDKDFSYVNPDESCGVMWQSNAHHNGQTRITGGTDNWVQVHDTNVYGERWIYVGFADAKLTCVRALDVTIMLKAKSTKVSGGKTYVATSTWFQERRYTCMDCTVGAILRENMSTVDHTESYYYEDGIESNPKLVGPDGGNNFKKYSLIVYEGTDGSISVSDFIDEKDANTPNPPPAENLGISPVTVSCCVMD